MAGVVKKGYLDVKTKGRMGSTYKRRFVVLRRNTCEGTKVVEITDNESDNSEDKEFLPLTGVWTVQDKASQNRKRYAFELVIGPHIMMTFSCPSLTEREEWTESFHILNRVSSYSPPLNAPDMYPVSLERSLSAVEIGVSGPCLLRIQDGAIVLYSECGRNKLHHWAAENVKNLTLESEQLKLEAYRPGSDTLMEFCFNTEVDTGRQILTSWNMALMESVDPQKLNLISNYILSHGAPSKDKEEKSPKSASLSRSFFGSLNKKGMNGAKDDKGLVVRRVRSFSEKTSLDVRLSPDSQATMIGSRLSVASQESYTINAVPQQGSDEEYRLSPPPIPPRAPRRPRSIPGLEAIDAARADPDYSYIQDDEQSSVVTRSLEVKTIEQQQSQNSPASVDKQLDDLMRDIEEDNKRKQRRMTLDAATMRKANSNYDQAKSRTLGGMRYSGEFARKKKEFYDIYGSSREASDYLEPVPSQRAVDPAEKRASNPPHLTSLLAAEETQDQLLQQIKRHSTSGDFTSMRSTKLSRGGASNHDYSTIPDRVVPPPAPQHFHTPSTDSTQSAPELPPRLTKRGGLTPEDPPSPHTRGGGPLASPTKRHQSLNMSGSSGGTKLDDISPYATSKQLKIETIQTSPKLDPSPPPLPPRSPVKHLRERASVPNTFLNPQHCTRCNGIKGKQSLVKTHSLADQPTSSRTHHHTQPFSGSNDRGSLPDLYSKETADHASSRPLTHTPSQTSYMSQSSDSSSSRGGRHSGVFERSLHTPPLSETSPTSSAEDETLESALQKLDECVKDLQWLETDFDLPEPPKRGSTQPHSTSLDAALLNTQQVQTDLLLAKKENKQPMEQLLQRSTSVTASSLAHKSRNIAPSSQAAARRSLSVHKSYPSVTNDATPTQAPPTVPPRSLASLNQQSNSPSSPPLSLPNPEKTPIHRYLTQNTNEKSSTVFIYHMKDPVRIAHN